MINICTCIWLGFLAIGKCDIGDTQKISPQNSLQLCSLPPSLLLQCWFEEKDIGICIDGVSSVEQCPIEATRRYINNIINVMETTDVALRDVVGKFDFLMSDKDCLRQLRREAYFQGQFIMEGFDSRDGCQYRQLMSFIAEENGYLTKNCSMAIKKLQSQLLRITKCDNLVSLSSFDHDLIGECISYRKTIADCFHSHILCNDTYSSLHKCFAHSIRNLGLCKETLVRRIIVHESQTWRMALSDFCTDHFTPFTRHWCLNSFTKLSATMASLAEGFHSPDSCRNRKLYLDHVIATSAPAKCRIILRHFTHRMLRKSPCAWIISSAITINNFNSYLLFFYAFSSWKLLKFL